MPGEVVGTAFVRIKAIVDGLGKDIKREVEKGIKDADLEGIGKKEGDKLGESLGESTVDSAKKTIKKESKGLFDDVAVQARATAEESRKHLSNVGDLSIDDDGSANSFFDRLKLRVSETDNELRNFFTRTNAGFRSMFDTPGGDTFLDSIRIRVGAVDEELRNFFTRTNAGFRSMLDVDGGDGFLDRIRTRIGSFDNELRNFFTRTSAGFRTMLDVDGGGDGVFDRLRARVGSIDNTLRSFFTRTRDGFRTMLDADGGDGFFGRLRVRISSIDNELRSFFSRTADGFRGFLDTDIGGGVFDRIRARISAIDNELRSFFTRTSSGFRNMLDVDGGGDGFFDRLRARVSSIDDTLRDFFTRTSTGFRNVLDTDVRDTFFDRVRGRVASIDTELRSFFTRTSAGLRNMLSVDGDGDSFFDRLRVRISSIDDEIRSFVTRTGDRLRNMLDVEGGDSFFTRIRLRVSSIDDTFRDFFTRTRTGLRNMLEVDGGDDGFFDRIRVRISSIDNELRDFFTRTGNGLRNMLDGDTGGDGFFDRLRVRISSVDGELRSFFTRTRTGFRTMLDTEGGEGFFDRLRVRVASIDNELRGFFDRTSTGLRTMLNVDGGDNFFDRLRVRVSSIDNTLSDFFTRTGDGFRTMLSSDDGDGFFDRLRVRLTSIDDDLSEFFTRTTTRFRTLSDVDGGDGFFDRLRTRVSSIDGTLQNFFTRTGTGFRTMFDVDDSGNTFFDRIRARVTSIDNDFRSFFARTSFGLRGMLDVDGGDGFFDRLRGRVSSIDDELQDFFVRTGDGFRDMLDGDVRGGIFERIRARVGSIDNTLRSFFIRTDLGFRNMLDADGGDGIFDRLRTRVSSIGDTFQGFFTRTRNGFRETFSRDAGGGFFDRLEDRVSSVGNVFQNFFTRVGAGFDNVLSKDRKNNLDNTLTDIGKKLKSFGDDAFASISKLPLVIGGIGVAIVGALPFIQDIGATILAYATGLVAQIGFLTTAIGGIGIAAVGALASVATTALPLLLAFKAETEELTNFKDSLKASGEEFLRIGVATQQTLLPALSDALDIIEGLVLPLSEFGLFVGRAVGDFARLAAQTLTGAEATGRFRDILQGALRILDLVLPTFLNLGGILSGIWVAALPAAERFTAIILGLTSRWRAMIDEGLRTGTLVDTFDLWFDRAVLLFGALGNVAGALFDILQIGADSSDSLFVRFDEWARRYRDFTESEAGQNKIKLIFDNALAVMREVNGVAADLFDGIFGRLGRIGGVDAIVEQLQDFRVILPEIQEAWAGLYTDIKRVVDFLLENLGGKVEEAIDELAEPLGRLGDQILRLLDTMDESGSFEVFLDLLRIMTDILSTLLAIPGFGTFIGYMLAFGAAAKIARIALGPFISILGSFITQIGQLVAARSTVALGEGATAITRFAAAFQSANAARAGGEAIGAGAAAARVGATGLAGTLGAGASALTGLLGPLALVGGALAVGGGFWFAHTQAMQRWRQEVRQVTEALGTLNGGLLITAEGINKYITEFSRFDAHNQEDDFKRIGTSARELSEGIADGTGSLQQFIDTALETGEINFASQTVDSTGQLNAIFESEIKSLEELQNQFSLTDEELERLMETQTVTVDRGTRFMIQGNADLIESYDELQRAIGQSVKDNIDAFADNATIIDLLGRDITEGIRTQINSLEPEDAVAPMREAWENVRVAAETASDEIIGVSDETRRAISEQAATAGDPVSAAIAEYELLAAESARITQRIINDLELFSSEGFREEFGEARQAVLDFSAIVDATDFSSFDAFETFGGLDALAEQFPWVASAAQNLFTTLQGLPEAEFNAAARAMGADADTLRGAMESAMGAIQELQDQAVESLPTIGSLLDDATEVREDGTQFFNPEGFLSSARDRIDDTNAFAQRITLIQQEFGDEAARLAASQGPEAAEALASMVGSHPDQVNQVIADMEAAETALRDQIALVLGPGLALEAATAAGLIGSDFTIGLSAGLQDPAAVNAIKESANEVEKQFSQQFQVKIVFDQNTLTYRLVPFTSSNNGNRPISGKFSEGGFVGNESPFNGPSGTDTVNAWLTPGEFVLRNAVAQAIPPSVLNALNAGDPRMIGLLNSLNRTRPAGVDAVVATVTAQTPAQAASGNFTIQQMNIEAPTPLETARQVADRLRIMQSQLSKR